ncbi:MAG TPA: YqgE/AlgH family protein [Conexibacter sp.]|nr:YqgE/AlgH family protein [Conexibacter sp.]
MESLKGKLLLASPVLEDPNFARTVVLIAEHTDEGAMGLVLNRPADVTVGESAPELEELVDAAEPIYVGGPVQPTSVIVLAAFTDPTAAGLMISDDVGFLSAQLDLAESAAVTNRTRVFAGHAGWGPGQLDEEMEREDWIVETPRPDELFASDPEELWSRVLTRKGGTFALVARMPLDPSLN